MGDGCVEKSKESGRGPQRRHRRQPLRKLSATSARLRAAGGAPSTARPAAAPSPCHVTAAAGPRGLPCGMAGYGGSASCPTAARPWRWQPRAPAPQHGGRYCGILLPSAASSWAGGSGERALCAPSVTHHARAEVRRHGYRGRARMGFPFAITPGSVCRGNLEAALEAPGFPAKPGVTGM